jgi:uncharacterized protein YdhG (YjbR/CyaY superfamily)
MTRDLPTAADVESYLAALPAPARAATQSLRTIIRSVIPDATETISYQMPAFRAHGRVVMTYGAFTDHVSLFPMSMAVIRAHERELGSRHTGKGTIRFELEAPIPAALVKKLVRARVAEIDARGPRR